MSEQTLSRGENGSDSNDDVQFSVTRVAENSDSFVSEPILPACYQQGGETYYISRRWQGQADATLPPLRDLEHATLTSRKIFQRANFMFSRTEELSFENSRYRNYVADYEICRSPGNNASELQKPEVNVERLLKENVKQLPAERDSDDISCARFLQKAASYGIHVEDPRTLSESSEEAKNMTALEASPCNLKESRNRTETPYGDGLMNLDSDLQSMKLEGSPDITSSSWIPNWMNDGFYLKDDSYFSTSYDSSKDQSNINARESSVGFEQNASEKATKPINISGNKSENPNVSFTPDKSWSNPFLLNSSSSPPSSPNCEGLSVKMSTPSKFVGVVARDRPANITSVSTQTDLIFNPSLDALPKKEMSTQGNQTSVLLKDAAVNTRQLFTSLYSEPISPIGSSLPSTNKTNASNTFDQNLNQDSCLADSYFSEQFTDIVPSTILQSTVRNPYKVDYPDVSSVIDTPPPSPETLHSDNLLYGTTVRPLNLYVGEPSPDVNEMKLDSSLYRLVFDNLLRQYPSLAKTPHELQRLAKRETAYLQLHKSRLNYTSPSLTEEPRAITKTNPSSKDLSSSNQYLSNFPTLSNDVNSLAPEENFFSGNNQSSQDPPDLRYPPYSNFQLPLPAKTDWNSKQLPEISSRNSQFDWGMGFNPAVTKHDLIDTDNPLLNSPKMIMKRVENPGWNATRPISINAKTSNLKYQNPSPEDCLQLSNDFQTNNWQQIIRKKKKFPFAIEQNKSNFSKVDANTRKGNYERLVQVILERLPNTDRTKVDELIREVRRRKNGLGGLTMREIVLEARSIRHEKTMIYGSSPVKDEHQCALCVEELQLKAQKQLECGHYFHEECIMAWVYRHKRSCPTCGRLVFFPENYPKLP